MKLFLALFCLPVLFMPSGALAEQFSGNVIKILDGDTLEVLHKKTPVRVRLQNIDAPEKQQPFGDWSGQQLKSLTANHPVTVTWTQKDRYGRILGQVSTATLNVNHAMVAAGAAWVYSQYNNDPVLLAFQRTAQQEKRGLWSETHPVEPWKWRRNKPALLRLNP